MSALDAGALRARLPILLRERARRELPLTAKSAAVLVPLVVTAQGVEVLFTLRTQDVPTHKGQVAFPGGGMEPQDSSVTATALRELQEELGLDPAHVEILGWGDDALSMGRERVTPVVGWLTAMPELRPSAREIADTFMVPLAHLMRPEDYYEEEFHAAGALRRVPFFRGGKHSIWGLTAWILRELLTVVDGVPRGTPPNPL